MAYQHQAQGYVDNQELARALCANRHARDLVRRILEEKPARGSLYELLAELAHTLGEQLDALTNMNEIRLAHQRRAQKSSGQCPSGAGTDEQ